MTYTLTTHLKIKISKKYFHREHEDIMLLPLWLIIIWARSNIIKTNEAKWELMNVHYCTGTHNMY